MKLKVNDLKKSSNPFETDDESTRRTSRVDKSSNGLRIKVKKSRDPSKNSIKPVNAQKQRTFKKQRKSEDNRKYDTATRDFLEKAKNQVNTNHNIFSQSIAGEKVGHMNGVKLLEPQYESERELQLKSRSNVIGKIQQKIHKKRVMPNRPIRNIHEFSNIHSQLTTLEHRRNINQENLNDSLVNQESISEPRKHVSSDVKEVNFPKINLPKVNHGQPGLRKSASVISKPLSKYPMTKPQMIL